MSWGEGDSGGWLFAFSVNRVIGYLTSPSGEGSGVNFHFFQYRNWFERGSGNALNSCYFGRECSSTCLLTPQPKLDTGCPIAQLSPRAELSLNHCHLLWLPQTNLFSHLTQMKSTSSLLIWWRVIRCCLYKITYLMRQDSIEKTQIGPQKALAEHCWRTELAFL